MPVSQVDFLIIGQGLAGSILAFELIARGRRVMVVDNEHKGSASQVAAGIINPITGHRLNLTDGFVDYCARATKFYSDFESALGVNVVKSVDQTRLVKNPGQANYLSKRLEQEEYRSFLEQNTSTNLFSSSEHGTAKIKQTLVVDTKRLLQATKDWLTKQSSYLSASVDYTQMVFTTDGVKYNNVTASRVIFCEGYQAINNPWLNQLPFKLAKGEILTVETPVETRLMLSWGNWLIPHKNMSAKLGASYAWQDTDLTPSNQVKEKLLDSLQSQTGLRPNVVNHEVGVRPTTTHRHAFVGPIKARDHAYCFNGFGSKGCLTIPSHATLLCDHLLKQTPLAEDISKWL